MSIHVIDHPLVADKIARLRDEKTDNRLFRALASELSIILAYEATRDLELKTVTVQTPVAAAKAKKLQAKTFALIPILRAGTGMLSGFLKLLPNAHVWHLGMRRDEKTLQPEIYYNNLPQNFIADEVFLLDPMLATGGSLAASLTLLQERGMLTKVKIINLIAAPEGVARLNQDFPQVEIFTAALDEKLNDVGYIVPGLGDAGDRFFGT
jgi:uracil phosphoribosyltransferase